MNWLKRIWPWGRKTKAEAIVSALPDPKRVMHNAMAWRLTLRRLGERAMEGALDGLDVVVGAVDTAGDALYAWQPHKSELLQVIKDGVDGAGIVGALIGASGHEKKEALRLQVKAAIYVIGLTDAAFDVFWRSVGDRAVEMYVEYRRG